MEGLSKRLDRHVPESLTYCYLLGQQFHFQKYVLRKERCNVPGKMLGFTTGGKAYVVSETGLASL